MSTKLDKLYGSKGPKKPKEPTRVPDTLRSEDTVEVILGLCEGPIEGFADGDKSFFVGDTPLQSQNGTYNFQDFDLKLFPGDEIPDEVVPKLGGFARAGNMGGSVSLAEATPVVRQTQDGNIDFLEIRLVVNQLYRQTDKGDVLEDEVEIQAQFKAISDTQWTNFFRPASGNSNIRIKGKTTSTYVKEYRTPVERIDEPYEIRVLKITPDYNDNEHYQNIAWESFQEIIAEKRTWPNTAILQVVGKATDQFSGIPQWKGIYKGKICLIPSNYDPIARTYDGIWDGTFKRAWTNCPPWIVYDLLINDRYGFNKYFQVNANKYQFYDAAVWCDQRVPDGAGGLQPRYTFNAYITEPRPGRELANYIAGTFNAALFDDLNGTVILKVDKDEQATALFTPENIVGEFDYSYADIASQYNDVTVTFLNPKMNWAEDRRRVLNQAHIDKYGPIPLDFAAFGCTDAHEAKRKAIYKTLTATSEIEFVSFTTNRRGQMVAPWEIILIADPDQGYGITGRVKSVDGTTVHLRDPIYLEAGISYTAKFQMPDRLFEVAITTQTTGDVYSFDVAGALPEDLPEKAVFELEHAGELGLPKPFRVLKIDEEDGDPDNYRIYAAEVNRQKWSASDGAEFPEFEQSYRPDNFRTVVEPATDLVFNLSSTLQGNRRISVLEMEWKRSPSRLVSRYEVWMARNGGTLARINTVAGTRFEYPNLPAGDYEFRIVAVSGIGQLKSAPLIGEFKLSETDRAIAAVTNLRMIGEPSPTVFESHSPSFEWDADLDPYFASFEVKVVDSATNDVLRTEHVQSAWYDYAFDKVVEDGRKRSIRIEVTVQDQWANRSDTVSLSVTNPAPALPNNLRVDPIFNGYVVMMDQPTERDWGSTLFWASTTSGFTPGPTTLVHKGLDTYFRAEAEATRYVRIAVTDTYNPDDFIVSGEYEVTPYHSIDLIPPGIPDGLTLTSYINDLGVVHLVATWNRNSADTDFSQFQVDIREGDGPWISDVAPNVDSGQIRKEWTARPNTQYSVRVRAMDVSGNRSIYSDIATHTTTKDSTPPGAMLTVNAVGAFKSVWLGHEPPADNDLAYVEIYESRTNDRGAVFRKFKTGANRLLVGSIGSAETRYYWWRAVDTSGNNGPWYPTSATAGIAATTARAVADDLAAGAVTIEKLASGVRAEIDKVSGMETAVGTLQQATEANAQAIVDEAQARIDADAAEAAARAAAITTEQQARATAIADEQQARAAAIASETQARSDAIADEVINRTAAIAAEATTRAGEIAAEATARSSAIAAEQQARITAISAEATTRANAITAEATARAAEIKARAEETAGLLLRGLATGVVRSNTAPTDTTKSWIDTSVTPAVLKYWTGSAWAVDSSANIKSVSQRVTTAEGTLSANSSAITSLTQRVTNAEGTLSTNSSAITSLSSSLSGVRRWSASYDVTATNSAKLTMPNGSPLSINASLGVVYTCEGQSDWTTNGTGIIGRFVHDGTSWSYEDIYRRNSIPNAPRFFLDSDGDPAVRLQSHSSIYRIRVTIEQTNGVATADSVNASAIQSLDTRVTSAEGTLTSQASALTSLTARIGAAEDVNAGQASAIQGLDTRVTSTEDSISSQGSAITSLTGRVSTAEGNITAQGSAISGLTTRMTAAEGSITAQASSITSIESSIDGIFRWSDLRQVSTGSPALLRNRNGSTPLNPGSNAGTAYTVEATTIGASLPTSALARFIHNGTSWALEKIAENGTNSTHPEFFLWNGEPALRLYNQASLHWCNILITRHRAATTPDRVNASAIQSLDTRVTAAEGSITSQASSITSLTSRIGAAEGVNTSQATAIQGLDTRVTAAEGSITSQGSAITTLTSRIGAAEGVNESQASAISGLDTRVTAAEGSITSQASSITTLTSRIGAAEGVNDNQATAISGLDTRVTAAEGTITSQGSAITSLTSRIGAAEGVNTTQATAIQGLDTRVTAAEGALSSQSSSITSLQSDLSNVGIWRAQAQVNGTNGVLVPNADGSTPLAQGWANISPASPVSYLVEAVTSGTTSQTHVIARFVFNGTSWSVTEIYRLNSIAQSPLFYISAGSGSPAVRLVSHANNYWVRFTVRRDMGMVTADSVNASAIQSLDTRVTAAEGSLTSQASSITSLTSRIGAAEGVNTTQSTAISGLETRVTAAEGSITSQGSSITSLTSRIGAAEGVNDNQATAISGLTTRVTAAEGTISSQANSITSLQSRMGAAEGVNESQATAISGLDTRVTAAEGTISSQGSAITSLTSRIGAAEGVNTTQATAIQGLETRVTANENALSSTSSAVTTLQGQLNNVGVWRTSIQVSGGAGSLLTNADGTSPLAQGWANISPGSPTSYTVEAVTSGTTTVTQAIARFIFNGTSWSVEHIHRMGTSSPHPDLYLLNGQPAIRAHGTSATYWMRLVIRNTNGMATAESVNASAIQTLQTRVTAAEGSITSQSSSITNLTNRITAAEGVNDNQASAISGLDSRVTTAEGVNTSQANSITSLTSRMDGVEGVNTTQATAISGLQTRMTAAEGSISSQASSITSLTSRIGAAEGVNTTQSNAISGLETRVTTAEGTITSQGSSITNLTGRVSTAEGNITSQGSAISGLTTRMSAAEGALSSQSSSITSLQSDVNGTYRWFQQLQVNTNSPALLRRRDGTTPLNLGGVAGAAYIAEATTIGTSQPTSAMVRFVHNGTAWSIEKISENGTSLNHPEFFLWNGEPAIRLYNQSTSLWCNVLITRHLAATTPDKVNATAIQSLDTRVTAAEGSITSQASSITSLTSRIGAAEGVNTTQASALSSLDTRVTAAEGVNTSQTNSITNLTGRMTSAEGTLSANSSAISGLGTRMTAAEGAITSQSSSITSLQSGLAAVDRWRTPYQISTSTPALLQNANGTTPLTTGSSSGANRATFTCEARTRGTTVQTSALARFTYNGSAWILEKLAEDGTNSTHPEFFLWNGEPAIRLYGHASLYWCDVLVERALTSTTPDKVNATAIQSLTTRVTAAEGTITSQGSAITSLTNRIGATEGVNSSQATAISGLETRVTAAEGVNTAQATSINSLSTTVGGHTTTISQHASSIDGIEAKYAVKVDNNGYISGFGLISTANTATPSSEFFILADRFKVAAPGITPRAPFVVQSGQVFIDNATIQANAITASKLAVVDTSNLILDPNFSDLSYWGGHASLSQVAAPEGFGTPFVGQAGAQASSTNVAVARGIQVTPGDQFHLNYQYRGVGSPSGVLATQIIYYSNSGYHSATFMGSHSAPSSTVQSYSGTTTVPAGATSAQVRFVVSGGGSGSYQFGNPRLRPVVSGVLIQDGAITAPKLTTGELLTLSAQIKTGIINDAHIANLSAAKLVAGSALASTITVSGTALGTIESRAADPAARINAASTTIDPGKILVSGSTTLASWRNGGDTTKIEGGAIAANTISANQLAVGLRGLTIAGLEFSPNSPSNNTLSWTSGTIRTTNDAGSGYNTSIPAGSVSWSSGTIYVYWTPGSSTLSTTTSNSTANSQMNIVLATYQGGGKLNATYSRTIVDGDQIRTGSLHANRIIANSIGATQIASNAIETQHLSALSVNSSHIQARSISTDKLSIGAVTDNLILNGGAEDMMANVVGGNVNSSGATVDSNTSAANSGSRGFRIGSGDGTAALIFRAVPVIPGRTYTVRYAARAVSAAGSGRYMRAAWSAAEPPTGYLSWYASSPTGSNAGPTTHADGFQATTPDNAPWVTGWTVYEATWTAPANARWMSLNFIRTTTNWVYLDDVELRPQLRSVHIENGSILADHIAAGSITADKLQAGAVLTNSLYVGSNANGAGVELRGDGAIITRYAGGTPAVVMGPSAGELFYINKPNGQRALSLTPTEFALGTDVVATGNLQANAVTIGDTVFTEAEIGSPGTSNGYLREDNVWVPVQTINVAAGPGSVLMWYRLTCVARLVGAAVPSPSSGVGTGGGQWMDVRVRRTSDNTVVFGPTRAQNSEFKGINGEWLFTEQFSDISGEFTTNGSGDFVLECLASDNDVTGFKAARRGMTYLRIKR